MILKAALHMLIKEGAAAFTLLRIETQWDLQAAGNVRSPFLQRKCLFRLFWKSCGRRCIDADVALMMHTSARLFSSLVPALPDIMIAILVNFPRVGKEIAPDARRSSKLRQAFSESFDRQPALVAASL